MKTRLPDNRTGRDLKSMLASIIVALFLAAGLFMASVWLPPLNTPVHAINAPPPVASLAPDGVKENGTLASFTALIPELASLHLPLIVR